MGATTLRCGVCKAVSFALFRHAGLGFLVFRFSGISVSIGSGIPVFRHSGFPVFRYHVRAGSA